MPQFRVPLWEGKEQVVFQIEAESKEAAFEQAKAYREQRFQERNTRAGLQAEREQTEKRLGDANWAKTKGVGAGLLQSGSDVIHGIGDAVNGVALAVADTGVLGEDVAARVKANRDELQTSNEEARRRIQEKVMGRSLTENEAKINEEMSERNVGLASLGTELIAGAGVGGAVLKASTAPRMIGLGALEGAGSAFLFSDTNRTERDNRLEARLGEAKLGGLLGAGLSTIPGVFAGAKNWLIRRVKNVSGNLEANKAALAEVGVDTATVGQLTGDPRILQIENESAGAIADQMLRKQQQQAVQGIARRTGVQLPEDFSNLTRGSRAVIQDGLNKVGVVLGKMRRNRNKAFEAGMNELEDIVGGKPVMNVNKFVGEANEIIDGVTANYRNIKLGRPFTDLLGEVNTAFQAGGATPKQMNSWLLRLGQFKKNGHGIFDLSDDAVKQAESTYLGHGQVIANQLKRSLETAFDASADSLGGMAGGRLKDLRKFYSGESERIAGIQQDFMTALGMNGSPNQILRKLAEADPDSIDAVMGAVQQMPGGQSWRNNLAQALFKQSVNDGSRAGVTFAQKAGEFNLKAFADSLADNAKRTKLGGILAPDREANLVKGLNALKVLFNDPRVASSGGVFKTHLPFDLQSLAINALSRDPGFTARLIAGSIQKGKGAEGLFYTKEGQDLLTGAVKSVVEGKNTGASIATINAILASMWGAGEADAVATDIAQGK
jgi:hypothetical protein